MSSRARCVVLALLILGTLGGVSIASADGPLSVSIVSVGQLPDGSTQLVLDLDDAGRPLTDLGLAEVAVAEDGSPAQVSDVHTVVEAGTSLAVTVAIDVSGSMAGAKLTAATSAASQLISDLGPNDQVGVVSFADAVTVIAPLSSDRTKAVSLLGTLQAKGNTALYEAVVRASSIVNASPLTRRAVILLSDGEEFGGVSQATREASLEHARTDGAVFYVIAAGSDADKTYLRAVADASRGRYFEAQSASDIAAVYASLEQLLRSQVVVRYLPPEAGADGQHQVTVTIRRNGATASASTSLQRAPTARTTAVPETTVAVSTPASQPAATATPSSSGNSNRYLLLMLPLGLAACAIGIWLIRRQRRAEPVVAPVRSMRAVPVEGPILTERPRARLESGAGGITVGSAPITIGTASGCDLVLTGSPGMAAEVARLWWRDGSGMIHSLDRDHPVLVNGEPAEWITLSDGDSVQFGAATFRYRIMHPEDAPTKLADEPASLLLTRDEPR